MVNPILQMLSQGNQNNDVMMKAVGAMMRGESPQSFLQDLAKNDPRLQGLDLSNPSKAAEELCKQNGKDFTTEKNSIMQRVSQFIHK